MLKRLYDWTMAKAASKNATTWMAGISFAESSFFPIPPDLLLVPMILADRKAAWRIATICTIASVAGGVAGYMIGYFLYEMIGQAVISFYNLSTQFEAMRLAFDEHGAEILFLAGTTPIPYKLVTITAGVAHQSLVVFIVASVLARGLRFFLLAALLYWFGPPIRNFIEKRLALVTTVFAVALVGGFVAIKLI